MTHITDQERADMVTSAAVWPVAIGDWDDVRTTARANTWALLAELAWPHLERFRSDLYHDAVVIEQALHGATEFFYAVNPDGTEVTWDRQLAEMRAGDDGALFIVTLRQVSTTWQLAVSFDTTWRNLRPNQEGA